MSAVFAGEYGHHHHYNHNHHQPQQTGSGNVSPVRAFREHAAAANRGTGGVTATAFAEPAAVWDPERDEMPSPFLVRRKVIAGMGIRGERTA